MADKEERGEAADGPRKSSKKIVLLLAVAIAALVGGGAYVVYALLAPKAAAEKHKEAEVEPFFLPLDPFTVNLKGSTERFTQVGLTVAITDPKTVEPIKARMPILRDRILRAISRKSAEDILAADGKERLTNDVLSAIKDALPEQMRRSVKEVLITGLIVQ